MQQSVDGRPRQPRRSGNGSDFDPLGVHLLDNCQLFVADLQPTTLQATTPLLASCPSRFLTGKHPFVETRILKDPNFLIATLFGFFIGILMFSGMALLPSKLQAGLRAMGFGIDIMDTGAACRTYNVLIGEERRVAAALLPVD